MSLAKEGNSSSTNIDLPQISVHGIGQPSNAAHTGQLELDSA